MKRRAPGRAIIVPIATKEVAVTGISGYSGTPQARKLGLRPGLRIAVAGRPAGWRFEDPLVESEIEHGVEAEVEHGVEHGVGHEDDGHAAPDSDGPVDVLLWFVPAAAELARMPHFGQRIFPAGALWVAWPRKAAGHVSDVDENLIRSRALGLGLVDVKVAAIDPDWSGLKLCWRRENRDRPA